MGQIGWPSKTHWVVPSESGGILLDPPLEEAACLVVQNHERRVNGADVASHAGLGELTRSARREIIEAAVAYTTGYRDLDFPRQLEQRPLILSGHQPELFHPGVWLKNFVLAEIARRTGAVPINLVIDADTIKGTSLPILQGTLANPQLGTISLDDYQPLVPFEIREVQNPECFLSFPQRVCEQLGPFVAKPFVLDLWKFVKQRFGEEKRLGYILAQSRHLLEKEWGLVTLEVPQSRVCRSRSHLLFVARLLTELPRFREVYNAALARYRRLHRVRSAAQPLPDLGSQGEWIEAPFWVWRRDKPRRKPLFVSAKEDRIVLSDRNGWEFPLDVAGSVGVEKAAECLADLASAGVFLRCRALMTTLWARLVLADYFIHGIGGAKYDEVTDDIIREFFGVEPPPYMVVSGTLWLVKGEHRSCVEDLRAVEAELRQVRFHPERLFTNGSVDAKLEANLSHDELKVVEELIAAKHAWISKQQTRENARERFLAIRQINEAFQPFLASIVGQLEERRRKLLQQIRRQSIFRYREFPFCFFEESSLREFLQQVTKLSRADATGSGNSRNSA